MGGDASLVSGDGLGSGFGGAYISISAPKFARLLCIVSTLSIIVALLLTHFNPKRFRIHPLPYLSDAGIRDPERILLSFGLTCTGVLFLPIGAVQYLKMSAQAPVPSLKVRSETLPFSLVIPTERLVRLILPVTLSTSFFVSLFSAVPGRMIFHHIFALFFASSAATWCTIVSIFSHACAVADKETDPSVWRRIRLNYALSCTQIACWVLFGIVWILLKIGWPTEFIPNKDVRFIYLAILEYVSTSCLIYFIRITSEDLAPYTGRISLVRNSPDVNNLTSENRGNRLKVRSRYS